MKFLIIFILIFVAVIPTMSQTEKETKTKQTAPAEVAQSCSAYPGNATFNSPTINGPVITGATGPISIDNIYLIPVEEIENITKQLKELRSLKDSLALQKTSIAEQQKILEQKEDENRKEKEKISKERIGIAQEKEALQQSKQAFNTEIRQVKSEFEKTVASISQTNGTTKTSPIEIKIQELTTRGEQIILSTETCLNNDFQVVPIKDNKTGKIIYGFSLDEIRKDPNYVLIDEYSEGFARVKQNNKFGFYDNKGKLAIDFKFDYAESYKNGFALVYNIGKWFVLDKYSNVYYEFPKGTVNVETLSNGNFKCTYANNINFICNANGIRLSEIYWEIDKFNKNGYSIVKKSNSTNSKGLINNNGILVIPCIYDKIYFFNKDENLLKVSINNYTVQNYGLINIDGSTLLECRFCDFIEIAGTTSIIKNTNGLYGLIDKHYNLILEDKYSKIDQFDTYGFAKVDKSGYKGIAAQNGRLIVDCEYYEVIHLPNSKVFKVKSIEGYGIINYKGKTIIKPTYSDIKNITTDLFIVTKFSKVGIANLNGKLLLKCEYSEIGKFEGNGCVIIKDGKSRYGIADSLGRIVVDFDYKSIKRIADNKYSVVGEDGKYGLIDINLGVLIPIKYEKGSPVKQMDDIYLAGNDFYLDKKTRFQLLNSLVDYNFDRTSLGNNKFDKLITNDLLIYKDKNYSSYLLLNTKTLSIVNSGRYMPIVIDANKLIKLSLEGGFRLIDTTLLSFKSETYDLIEICKNNMYLVKRNSKYGFLNSYGKLIIECKYSGRTNKFEKDDTAIVEVLGKLGVINVNGLEFIPPIFDSIERTENGFYAKFGESIYTLNALGKCISANIENYQLLIKQYHQKK